MCTTTGSFLRWRFRVTLGLNDTNTITRTIQAAVPAGDAMSQFVVNSTMFIFSRTSADNSPVMSKIVIGPVSSSLNGTVINCIDSDTSSSTATTIVTREEEPLQELVVQERLVEFETDGVTITLEWDELNPLYSVYVTVVPATRVNISGSTAKLIVTYNVMYNVSIMISHLCGQNNVTVLSEVYYHPHTTTSNATPMKFCGNPEDLISDSVIVSGYTTPAVKGTMITFHCSPGAILHGINSSICMENGEWVPATNEVMCSSIMVHKNADSQGNNIEIIVGCSLGVTLGLAIIAAVATIIGFLIKARFKDSTTVFYKRTTQQEGTDAGIELSPVPIENNHSTKVANVQTGGLVYADIGQATFNCQRQLLPGIPDLDDSPLEYASINHNAHVEPSASQNTVTNIDIPSINLDSLLIQLRPQITAKWYQFGEAAGIEKAVLDSFVKSCSPDDCIIEMLDYWLRKSPKKLTWRDVAGVLKAINSSQMANEIERVYVTGKLPVEVDMDWVPQTIEYHEPEIESPPPIPPKINEIIDIPSFDAPQNGTKVGLNQSADTRVLTNDSAPVLPPKPKCGQMMTDVVPPRPPRF